MSVVFKWKEDQLENLLASCGSDETLPIILEYLPVNGKVLEAGCGAGRYVKYLTNLSWDIIGLEYSGETLGMIHRLWPELPLLKGDITQLPFRNESLVGILSLGVIEHFVNGPEVPLNEMYRVMKKGGIAIITVPCLNKIRRLKRRLWLKELFDLPRALACKSLLKRQMSCNRVIAVYQYAVNPAYGQFYEYWMAPDEFRKAVEAAGFEIVTHAPLGHIDGMYHECNPFRLLVSFREWKFRTSKIYDWLNRYLRKFPFLHCHMQVIVALKK